MVVSAVCYHLHSILCCQDEDDDATLGFPSHCLAAVSDKRGWQDLQQKLSAAAFSEACRFHSLICDCLSALRPLPSVLYHDALQERIWHVMEA